MAETRPPASRLARARLRLTVCPPLPRQGTEEMKLKPQHISALVVSLADFVRMADRKIIASTLSQLKLELDFDSSAISQLQVVLFGFQDAVSIQSASLGLL